MLAKPLLLPLSSGRPSTADQNVATFSASSQSNAMLPTLAVTASSRYLDACHGSPHHRRPPAIQPG
jgi:hypothetical protein